MSNVVISGGNGGFGLLTVRKFAESGHTVRTGFRSKDRAGDLDALALEFPKLCPVHLNVTDRALIDRAISAFPRHANTGGRWAALYRRRTVLLDER